MPNIKEQLIAEIEGTQNDALLAEILEWLRLETLPSNNQILQLSADEEAELMRIRAEMIAGDYLTDEEVDAELERWVEK